MGWIEDLKNAADLTEDEVAHIPHTLKLISMYSAATGKKFENRNVDLEDLIKWFETTTEGRIAIQAIAHDFPSGMEQ